MGGASKVFRYLCQVLNLERRHISPVLPDGALRISLNLMKSFTLSNTVHVMYESNCDTTISHPNVCAIRRHRLVFTNSTHESKAIHNKQGESSFQARSNIVTGVLFFACLSRGTYRASILQLRVYDVWFSPGFHPLEKDSRAYWTEREGSEVLRVSRYSTFKFLSLPLWRSILRR